MGAAMEPDFSSLFTEKPKPKPDKEDSIKPKPEKESIPKFTELSDPVHSQQK